MKSVYSPISDIRNIMDNDVYDSRINIYDNDYDNIFEPLTSITYIIHFSIVDTDQMLE